MDNVLVSEADNLGLRSLQPPSNYPMDLEAFDLDEALAAAGESCRRFTELKCFVSSLPTVQDMEGDDVCSVCMEGFDQHKCLDSQGNKRIPCGHVYHAACIATWISHCNSCPLCRSHIFLPCN